MTTPNNIMDLTGKRFGRWTVLHFAHAIRYPKCAKAVWRCRCDCGTEKNVRAESLRNGTSLSCRCLQREVQRDLQTIHGHTRHNGLSSAEYTAWAHMIQRCTNPNCEEWKNYGLRGISVCGYWLTFSNFFADMGSKPTPNHTLERVNNNESYSADNCVWATYACQSRNHRRNRWIEWNGERRVITD